MIGCGHTVLTVFGAPINQAYQPAQGIDQYAAPFGPRAGWTNEEIRLSSSMIGENRQLVTDGPVEFGKNIGGSSRLQGNQ